jgi:hypothetical protein
MVTCRVAGVTKPVGHLQLSVGVVVPPMLSLVPTSVRSMLVDPHWCWAMEEEYDALLSNNTWDSPSASWLHSTRVLRLGAWIESLKVVAAVEGLWVMHQIDLRPAWVHSSGLTSCSHWLPVVSIGSEIMRCRVVLAWRGGKWRGLGGRGWPQQQSGKLLRTWLGSPVEQLC